MSRGDAARAAQWAVSHASLHDPEAVADLLRALRLAGADDAVRTLLDRDPASQVSLGNPFFVGPFFVGARLLEALRAAGADDAVRTRAIRAAAQASLDNPSTVIELLEALSGTGVSDAIAALAIRAANAGMFDLFLVAHPDEAPNYLFGREPDGAPSRSWSWQEPTSKTTDA